MAVSKGTADPQIETYQVPTIASARPQTARGELRIVLGLLARNRSALVGAGIYLGFVLMAFLAPLLAPSDPQEQTLTSRLKPPVWMTGGSSAYVLGADNLGRDIASRLIYGARVSIVVGAATVSACAVLGSVLGAVAGYWRGRLDAALMLVLDIWMAFPSLVLAIALSAALGPSLTNLILALVLTGWVAYCRIIRGEVLSLREREFVLAARVSGATGLRIVAKHLLPNVLAPILVLATLEMATVIIAEAALSFLGLGVQAEQPTWGGMLNDGRQFLRQAWWLATFPGAAISLLVLGINLFGDGLRDALDPRLRR
ncbi:MAG: ABC transporter permease [Chloroflexi bacterium]|nr:ABC transporter permease [Chloroflexota bacterium]